MESAWLLITVGIVGALALFGLIGYVILVIDKKRGEAMRQVAEEMSFEFVEDIDPESLAFTAGFELFGRGRWRWARNLMRGRTSDADVSMFDYGYTVRSGKSSSTCHQTMICFDSESLDLPRFVLQPEHLLHKLSAVMVLGYSDINFDDHPRFSGRYHLTGADEQAVRRTFDASVLEYFERHEGLNVEGNGRRLIVYRPCQRVRRHKLRDFLADAFELYGLLKVSREETVA